MRRLRSCLCLASRAQGLAATLDQACPSAASSITLDIVSTSGRGWLCLRGHQQGISTSTAATAAIGGSSQGRVKQAEAAEAGEPALIRVVLRQAGVLGDGEDAPLTSVPQPRSPSALRANPCTVGTAEVSPNPSHRTHDHAFAHAPLCDCRMSRGWGSVGRWCP